MDRRALGLVLLLGCVGDRPEVAPAGSAGAQAAGASAAGQGGAGSAGASGASSAGAAGVGASGAAGAVGGSAGQSGSAGAEQAGSAGSAGASGSGAGQAGAAGASAGGSAGSGAGEGGAAGLAGNAGAGGYPGCDALCVAQSFATWKVSPDAAPSEGDFIDGSSAIKHKPTGVSWLKASVWEGSTWQQAKDYCASIKTDGVTWRLPRRIEFVAILGFEGQPFNQGVFDKILTQISGYSSFWTGSRAGTQEPAMAYLVDVHEARVYPYDTTLDDAVASVICVRSEQDP